MDQRQHYLNTRSNNQLDLGLAYELYMETEHPTPKLPLQHFQHLFMQWVQFSGSELEKYFKYYDQKFNVKKLIRKDGSVIFL